MSTSARSRAAVFLAAFLSFSLELAAAKALLPRHGGAAFVWTGAVTIFQVLLLAAYAWSGAGLRRRFFDGKVHAALVAAAALAAPFAAPASAPSGAPLLALARDLLLGFGAPFFALAATAPTVQAWATRAGTGGEDPYGLYGASNWGAFAALAAYPLLVEPFAPLTAQAAALRVGTLALAALLWSCAPSSAPVCAAALDAEAVPARRRALWLLLGAAPCAATLATTNLFAFDFAAVPLMWTVPLAIYLATFALCFSPRRLRDGAVDSVLLPTLGAWTALCALAAALAVAKAGDSTPVQTLRRLLDLGKFGYLSAALFTIGIVCHRSLAASRPSSEKETARFYLTAAAGGALGSACVSVLIPWAGRPLGTLALDWLCAAALACAALVARDWDAWSARARRRPLVAAAAVLSLLVAAAGALLARPAGTAFAARDYYGVNAVVDGGGMRRLFHGNTDHGAEWLDAARAGEPLTYYNRFSPLAEAWSALGAEWKSVGVVGLGAGSIASYAGPGTTLDFYELDPEVETIARRWFRFLDSSKARVRVILGDARLSLARGDAPEYDALILDAFNSGAVPIHLLTKEALILDLSRLARGGVLLLHVSNRYLDLRPILAADARELGLSGACKRQTQKGKIDDERTPSSWTMLTRDPEKARALIREKGWTDLADPAFARGRAWTDDHAALLPALAL